MKRFGKELLGALFDLRVIVGIGGILLSIIMHELLHIIVHWDEITSINIFPNTQTIVEVVFIPSTAYDLVVEEAIAYIVSMVTFVLTAKLIVDIQDSRGEKNAQQASLLKDFNNYYKAGDEQRALNYLDNILG